MTPRGVGRRPSPADSMIAGWYPGAPLLDTYGVLLPAKLAGVSMRALGERALDDPPVWVEALMAVRDGVMARFGVKTSTSVAIPTRGAVASPVAVAVAGLSLWGLRSRLSSR